MARCVVALGDEDVVVDAALQWLVERDWWAHKLLFHSSEAFEAGCELQVVVGCRLGDRGDDGDVVAFRAHAVGA